MAARAPPALADGQEREVGFRLSHAVWAGLPSGSSSTATEDEDTATHLAFLLGNRRASDYAAGHRAKDEPLACATRRV